MASWWAGIAAKSGSAPSNPGQPMPPPGLAPPSGTPMTPMSGDGSMPIPGYGFPPTPTGILLWSSSDYVRSNGYDSSSYARRDGSNSVKNVGDLCRRFVIDRKIRERKSLGSCRPDFKF